MQPTRETATISSIIAFLSAILASSANAAVVVWQLDASFFDGTTVMGSFEYDASNESDGRYSNIDILIDNSPNIGPFRYTDDDFNLGTSEGLDLVKATGAFAGVEMFLDWSPATLTDAGGAYVIFSGSIGHGPRRDPVINQDASSVSSVPLPAAAWLLGSGLIGLIRVARHKPCT